MLMISEKSRYFQADYLSGLNSQYTLLTKYSSGSMSILINICKENFTSSFLDNVFLFYFFFLQAKENLLRNMPTIQ